MHFGANGIIEKERRPFKNANEYAEEQIAIWNGQTKEGDIIKHLGDWENRIAGMRHLSSWKK